MTAIEDDLTRVLRDHEADVVGYDAGEINGCMCGLDLSEGDNDDRWDQHSAHLAAALAPIVAAHVAAGQERALLDVAENTLSYHQWDNQSAFMKFRIVATHGSVQQFSPEQIAHWLRSLAATYTGTSSRPDAADVSQGHSETADSNQEPGEGA